MNNDTNKPQDSQNGSGLGLPPIPIIPSVPVTTVPSLPPIESKPIEPMSGGLPPMEPTTTATPSAPPVPEAQKPIEKPKKKISKKMVIGGVLALFLLVGAAAVSFIFPGFRGDIRQRASYGGAVCDGPLNHTYCAGKAPGASTTPAESGGVAGTCNGVTEVSAGHWNCSWTAPGICTANGPCELSGGNYRKCNGAGTGWVYCGADDTCTVGCTQGATYCTATKTAECLAQGKACDPTIGGGACGAVICTPVDGGWSAWGACSVPCDGGTQTKSCNNPAPSCGGADCSGSATQACNTQACAATYTCLTNNSNNYCARAGDTCDPGDTGAVGSCAGAGTRCCVRVATGGGGSCTAGVCTYFSSSGAWKKCNALGTGYTAAVYSDSACGAAPDTCTNLGGTCVSGNTCDSVGQSSVPGGSCPTQASCCKPLIPTQYCGSGGTCVSGATCDSIGQESITGSCPTQASCCRPPTVATYTCLTNNSNNYCARAGDTCDPGDTGAVGSCAGAGTRCCVRVGGGGGGGGGLCTNALTPPTTCSGKSDGYKIDNTGAATTSDSYYCKCVQRATGLCSCLPGPGVSPTAAPTPVAGSCAHATQDCNSTACCDGENLYCQGTTGNRVCQQDDGSGRNCGAGGVCGGTDGFRGHQCSSLTNGQCLEGGNTYSSWAAARDYSAANGCGQADEICVGGTRPGTLCGGFEIITASCGTPGTPPPGGTPPAETPPPGTAAACVNTRIFINSSATPATAAQMNALRIGDRIIMVVVGNDPSIVGARFDVKIGGQLGGRRYEVTSYLTPIRADSVKEYYYDFPITEAGAYTIEGYVNTVAPTATATPIPTATATSSPIPTATATAAPTEAPTVVVPPPPVPPQTAWQTYPFPTDRIDAASAYFQPDGLLRANVFRDSRYWGYECNTGVSPTVCTAKITRPLSEWASGVQGTFQGGTSGLPTDSIDAITQYMLGNGKLRSTVAKGPIFWVYDCTFQSGTAIVTSCDAKISRTMTQAFSFISDPNGAWTGNPIPTTGINGLDQWIQPDGSLRTQIYKDNRYWAYLCNIAANGDVSSCLARITTTLDGTSNIPNASTIWAGAGFPFPVTSQNAWMVYMQGPTTLRANAFFGDRYWGYTCEYAPGTATVTGCTAGITWSLTQSANSIQPGPAVQGTSTSRTRFEVIRDTVINTINSIFKFGN